MSVVLAPGRSRLEMARRAWRACDLAQAAHLSAPTVAAALAGMPISPNTLRKIAIALAAAPPVPGADAILLPAAQA